MTYDPGVTADPRPHDPGPSTEDIQEKCDTALQFPGWLVLCLTGPNADLTSWILERNSSKSIDIRVADKQDKVFDAKEARALLRHPKTWQKCKGLDIYIWFTEDAEAEDVHELEGILQGTPELSTILFTAKLPDEFETRPCDMAGLEIPTDLPLEVQDDLYADLFPSAPEPDPNAH